MQALGSDHLGEFELLMLLAVRGLGREASGGAIQLHLSIRARREVALGTIAKTLHRLRAKGFVRSWRGASRPVPGGRSRIHYALTPTGVQAINRTLRGIARLVRGR